MTTLPAAFAREINYVRESRDFELVLNGKVVGFARSYLEGEQALDALVYDILAEASAEAEPALCCERCGAEVASEDGTLVGGEMHCADCALAAELRAAGDAEDAARAVAEEAALGAYLDTHGHDPAAWPATGGRCSKCGEIPDVYGRCGCHYRAAA